MTIKEKWRRSSAQSQRDLRVPTNFDCLTSIFSDETKTETQGVGWAISIGEKNYFFCWFDDVVPINVTRFGPSSLRHKRCTSHRTFSNFDKEFFLKSFHYLVDEWIRQQQNEHYRPFSAQSWIRSNFKHSTWYKKPATEKEKSHDFREATFLGSKKENLTAKMSSWKLCMRHSWTNVWLILFLWLFRLLRRTTFERQQRK